MVYANMRYHFSENIHRQFQKCIAYVNNEKLADRLPGCYEICGRDLFVNIAEYETRPEELITWEAHKEYIDLHYVLRGRERMNMSLIDNMQQGTYDSQTDSMALTGEKSVSAVIGTDEYIVFYPEDVHMTGIQVQKPEKVKKAIFKIRVES